MIRHLISKRDLYYDDAMRMYFQESMCGTHICKILPISRSLLYKWIAIFVSDNSQELPMKKEKAVGNKSETAEERPMEDLTMEVQSLQAEIKKLRSQLIDAEIKAEAYNELIDVAEAKFKI